MKRRARSVWLTAVFCAVVGAALRWAAPSLADSLPYSSIVRDRHDQVLRISLAQDEKYRLRLPLKEIPRDIRDLLLAYEDQYFFFHPGVNPVALLRAGVRAVRDPRPAGASTLTMQVARLLYDMKTRSVAGKIKQIAAALWLELRYSKKEILEAYFQLAPYGGNIEGLRAAAYFYFDRDVAHLTLEQAASLLLIPQSPNRRKFQNDGAIETTAGAGSPNLKWTEARKVLIERWNNRHLDNLIDIESVRWPQTTHRRGPLPYLAPHFVNMALERSAATPELRTTLDLQKQKMIESLMRQYLARKKNIGVQNASALLVDLEDLAVVGYVGSADFWSREIQGQVDGVRARRSPGSALKPFIYALGMDQGLIHPLSLVRDTPRSFRGFDPENFERGFHGPLSATEALNQSRNIPAVDLAMRLHDPNPYEFLRNLGVPLRGDADFYGLTVVLGGAEVTLEEMVGWYAALARQESPRPLVFKKNAAEKSSTPSWAISRESGYLVLNMLKSNPRGDVEGFNQFRRNPLQVAWKTGTSSGFRDAWTIGVFNHYALGIWMGNFSGESNPSLIGREMAAPLFFEIAEALDRTEPRPALPRWQSPLGLRLSEMEVCSRTGGVPNDACTHRVKVQIMPGKSPIAPCTIHKKIAVSKSTGLRICPTDRLGDRDDAVAVNSDVVFKSYEFWPSDVESTLRDLGFHLQSAPPYPKSCTTGSWASTEARGLEIQSPREGVTYTVQWNQKEKSQIPFTAGSDQLHSKISWFVGGALIGQTRPAETLYWTATPGHYSVTATDDYGRSESRAVDVQMAEGSAARQ